jgi:hypothetical protein
MRLAMLQANKLSCINNNHSLLTEGAMPPVKAAVTALFGGVLLSLATAVIGFLNTARLEVSFDKLKDFDPLNLATYKSLGTSIRFDVEISHPEEYTVYSVDIENDSPAAYKSSLSLKNFKLSNRLQGSLTDDRGIIFSVIGFYNSDRIVFSHRGPSRGVGIYLLDAIPVTGMKMPVYLGYQIAENQAVERTREITTTQCPILMLSASDGLTIPTVQAAAEKFEILKAGCSRFKMETKI